jgi:hypothetical protein
MSSICILIIGAIVVGSVTWQILLFAELEVMAPVVLIPPALIGAIVVAGVLVYSIFLWFDPAKTGTGLFEIGVRFFWALLFLIILAVENVFGPSVLGLNAAYTIYNYCEHGVFEILPVMAWTIKLLIHAAPQSVITTYTIIFLLISAACNGVAVALFADS